MELNVSRELKSIGVPATVRIEVEYGAVDFNGRQILFSSPLVMELSYVFDGKGFTLTGELGSALVMNCTKCNQEFEMEFTVPLSERFIRASEEEADANECYPFSGETLKLDQMVLDSILLGAPMFGLCKEDCKGLCPLCGCNLNSTQCACSNEAKNANFAALQKLAQLLNDEEEV